MFRVSKTAGEFCVEKTRDFSRKVGILWDFFNIHSVAKDQKREKGPFGKSKNFSKKVSQHRGKKVSFVPIKVQREHFCFGILVKKISGYAPVCTQNLWVVHETTEVSRGKKSTRTFP